MIELKNVYYDYKTPLRNTHALKNITVPIHKGQITAVIGHTGSGKSTMMEIMAGLIRPDRGSVKVNGREPSPDMVGLVFQYPEYQLFAETVYDDISFGPKNIGLSRQEIERRVITAAKKTRITSDLLKRSPFELSGGQKRLAALAGILAMERDILLLDEPAAGLDPSGRQLIFSIMRDLLCSNPDMTVVFVTHSMEDAAELADNILVLNDGILVAQGTPEEVFSQKDLILSCGLDIPEMMKLSELLLEYNIDIKNAATIEEAYDNIVRRIRENA